MYQFFCDSNCELWHTTVKELGINFIRMPYVLNDEEYYYDLGETYDPKAFFDAMRNGAVPKTNALNEFDYLDYFEPILARGEDIYYITFSHEMSGTFNAMRKAIEQLKEKYPEREIRYKNSKSISMGSGLISYYGALEYKKGATMDELDAFFDTIIDNVATYFVVSDLTYLYRGGRVSGVARVFGNLLGIKPILSITDEGKIVNVEKARGFKKALNYLLDTLKNKGSELDKYKLFVLHADVEADANAFADVIRGLYPNTEVIVQPIGPVIGSHCGPGTIGIIFHAKER